MTTRPQVIGTKGAAALGHPVGDGPYNVVREPGRTCVVCAAPVAGFALCWRCRGHRQIPGVADVVAPLVSAIAGGAPARLLSHYKNHPQRRERELCAVVLAGLLGPAARHERCLAAVTGVPVSVRAVVPSVTSRPGAHPLTAIPSSRGLVGDTVLSAAFDAPCDRSVRLDKFVVSSPDAVRGRHVLLFDDVWTTGSNAQSAALSLRRAGAAAVSVLVIGRWLNPGDTVTAGFVRGLAGAQFDPQRCPVTGDGCPPHAAAPVGLVSPDAGRPQRGR